MNQLKLSPFLRVGIQSKKLYLGFGSIQKVIESPSEHEKYLEVLSRFTTPQSWKKQNESEDELIQELMDSQILIPEGDYQASNRYSRHHLYYLMSGGNPGAVQEKLKNAHVMVLGCGGIGNLLATALATSGVGKITLVDNDTVELSNLTRQYLFRECDVGAYKVDLLKERILERNRDCSVDSIKKHIRTMEDLYGLPEPDFIVASADVDDVCDLINLYAFQKKIAWLNVGYIEDIAVWGPLVVPGKTGCIACQNNIADEKSEQPVMNQMMAKINKNYQPPSTGPINMLAISLASFDILRYLGGFGKIQSLNTRIGLWTHDLKFEKQDYSKNQNCKVCGG